MIVVRQATYRSGAGGEGHVQISIPLTGAWEVHSLFHPFPYFVSPSNAWMTCSSTLSFPARVNSDNKIIIVYLHLPTKSILKQDVSNLLNLLPENEKMRTSFPFDPVLFNNMKPFPAKAFRSLLQAPFSDNSCSCSPSGRC